MKDFVTATEIIRDEKEYDTEKNVWIPFDKDFRKKAFNAFKNFVACTARGERRRRIYDGETYNVKDWGILGRLSYYPDTDKVEYCCGQEWYSEMAILRDAFDWKVRR